MDEKHPASTVEANPKHPHRLSHLCTQATMQLIRILAPLAMLASFIAASPLEARDTHLTAVDTGKPESSPADGALKPSVAAHIEGGEGTTGVSKRTDFNALDERAPATLIVCTNYNCRGSCWSYNLYMTPWKCYGVHWYNSVYVSHGWVGLPFGVFVGPNCHGSHSPTYS